MLESQPDRLGRSAVCRAGAETWHGVLSYQQLCLPGLSKPEPLESQGNLLTAELALQHGLSCHTAGGTHRVLQGKYTI